MITPREKELVNFFIQKQKITPQQAKFCIEKVRTEGGSILSLFISEGYLTVNELRDIHEGSKRVEKKETRMIGPYEVICFLGRGAVGEVYKVRDAKSNFYAIKCLRITRNLSPKQIQRFKQEQQVMYRLNHPNIVKIRDFGVYDDIFCLVMDYIGGKLLADIIHQIPLETALKWAYTLAKALQYAQKHHIIHRDIKPANIMITQSEVPILLDFGFAKMKDSISELTRTNAIIGTPRYMPPEQALGKSKHVDHRSDIYALGVVLYEMITGKKAISCSGNAQDILREVLHVVPPKPSFHIPNLSKDIDYLCMKAIEKDVLKRFQNWDEFINALSQCIQKITSNAKTQTSYLIQNSLNDRYNIDKKIGSGGMGEVYLGYDEKENLKKVAIKKLFKTNDPTNKKRFKREYQLLKAVEHPNLIKAYDYFEENNHLFMILEYVDGSSMADLLKAQKCHFSFTEQLSIATQIARAVEIINFAGIIHRDVKPGNIIINKKHEVVKLLDLGIGKKLINQEQTQDLSITGAPIGTLTYMSPEQTEGKVTETTDVFSLGVTLYQFFLGKSNSPFLGTTGLSTVINIVNTSLPSLYSQLKVSEITPSIKALYLELSSLLSKALEKVPDKRCSSEVLANTLENIYQKALARADKQNETFTTLTPKMSENLREKLLKIRRKAKEQTREKRRRRVSRMTKKKVIPHSLILLCIVICFSFFLGLGGLFQGKKQQQRIEKKDNIEQKRTKLAEKYYRESFELYEKTQFDKAWKILLKACSLRVDERYLTQKAVMLWFGRGTLENREEANIIAKQQYAKLIKNHDITSLCYLGDIYKIGVGVERNIQKALYYFHKAAKQNSPRAMYLLADMHSCGFGVKQNYKTSAMWYKKAIEFGHFPSMGQLGFLYYKGVGVMRDYKKAVYYYRQAADWGYLTSMYNMGVMYQNGLGVNQNFQEAMKWYKKVAQFGHATAMNNIGIMYEFGLGRKNNVRKAFFWYQKGAELGDSYAMMNLAEAYSKGQGTKQDYKKAFHFFFQSAKYGNEIALNSLGVFYQKGLGTKKNDKKAFEAFQESARLGNYQAMYNLSVAYMKGIGVKKDRAKSDIWYEKYKKYSPKK